LARFDLMLLRHTRDAARRQLPEKASVPSYSVHLDAARSLAALAVFIGHGTFVFLGTTIHEQVNSKLNRPATAVASYNPAAHTHLGHQAVIIFFILSGYLVGGGALRAMRQGVWSTKAYLLQRCTRLWVVLIPSLLLTVLLNLAASHWLHQPAHIYSNLSTFGHVGTWISMQPHPGAYIFAGNLFFLQGILVPVINSNAPLWSLSYEFWYYLMFPLLLVGLMSSSSLIHRAGAIVVLVTMLLACGAEISLYFLIWIMGVLVYCIPVKIPPTHVHWIAPLSCALFAVFNLYAVVFPYNLVASDFTTGVLFSITLWLLLHFRQPARDSLYRDLSKGLSAMSYTLYTVHYPVIMFVGAWLGSKSIHPHFSVQAVGILLAVYAVTFLLAWLFYRCFEANTGRVRRFLAVRIGV